MAQAQSTQYQHLSEVGRFLTVAELLSISNEQPIEIVNGEIILVSPVQQEHNTLCRYLQTCRLAYLQT
jgi:hypothetical protein